LGAAPLLVIEPTEISLSGHSRVIARVRHAVPSGAGRDEPKTLDLLRYQPAAASRPRGFATLVNPATSITLKPHGREVETGRARDSP